MQRVREERDTVATDTALAISLVTDKPRYAPGEPIVMTLTVRNGTAEQVALSFRDGQRYEFTIQDGGGRVVWRWSEGQMFAQVLGGEMLWPRQTRTYRERYEGRLAVGTYRLTGRVVAVGRELVDTAEVTVSTSR